MPLVEVTPNSDTGPSLEIPEMKISPVYTSENVERTPSSVALIKAVPSTKTMAPIANKSPMMRLLDLWALMLRKAILKMTAILNSPPTPQRHSLQEYLRHSVYSRLPCHRASE